jgi:hypothetical protein
MKLTEKILLEIGFEKINVSREESGDEPYHYFVYEFSTDIFNDLSLISNEGKEGFYTVELFNSNGYGYCETKEEVEILIKILSRKNK